MIAVYYEIQSPVKDQMKIDSENDSIVHETVKKHLPPITLQTKTSAKNPRKHTHTILYNRKFT